MRKARWCLAALLAACGPHVDVDAGREDAGAADAAPGDSGAAQDAAVDAGDGEVADAGWDAGSDPGSDGGAFDGGTDAGPTFVPPAITSREGPGRDVGSAPTVPSCLQTSYGGEGYDQLLDVQPVGDGYLAAGTTTLTTSSFLDGWLLRLDASGDVVWSKQIGASWRDGFEAAVPTADGGFVALGYSQIRGPGISSDSLAALAVKVDAAGALVWDRRLVVVDGSSWGRLVFEEPDASLLLLGEAMPGPSGTWDLFVTRLEADGTTRSEAHFDLGGEDELCAVERTSDGGLLVVGRSFGDFFMVDDEIFALRLDASGREVWRRTYGTTHTQWSAFRQRPCAVSVSADDGADIVVTDRLDPFAQSVRVVTVRPDGSVLRDRLYYATEDRRATAAARTSDGDLIVMSIDVVTGGPDMRATRFDGAGDIRWSTPYGGSAWDWPNAIRRHGGHVPGGGRDGLEPRAGHAGMDRPSDRGRIVRVRVVAAELGSARALTPVMGWMPPRRRECVSAARERLLRTVADAWELEDPAGRTGTAAVARAMADGSGYRVVAPQGASQSTWMSLGSWLATLRASCSGSSPRTFANTALVIRSACSSVAPSCPATRRTSSSRSNTSGSS